MKTFTQALDLTELAITAELPLTPDSDRASILREIEPARSLVDAVHIPDNRFGRIHMSPLAVAAMLLSEQIDPVVEFSCRNRNRVALLSDLLGARALGVTSLMLVRGKKAPQEYMPQAKYLVDTNVTELIELAKNVYADEELGHTINYLLGTTATVHEQLEDWNPERIGAKSQAGAGFIQTQPCFNAEALAAYVRHLITHRVTHNVSIVVSTTPLASYDEALQLLDGRTHLRIPASILDRLKNAANPQQEGIDICAEFLQEAAAIPGVSGVHLCGTNSLQSVAETLLQSGICRGD